MTQEQYANWLDKEINDANEISGMALIEAKQFWKGKLKAFEKAKKKLLTVVAPSTMPALVVYKDGSYVKCEDGATWEYENDPNYLITIK